MKNKKYFLAFLVVMLAVIPQISLSAEEKSSEKEPDKIVITAEDIKKMNARTITELLNQMPGISAGETSVKLRGSYKVRVLLDDRPINDPLSSHGGIKWNLVSLDNIERVEIYKGSGAVAFGDGTSGGAIIITSKKVCNARSNVEASWGNYDTQNYGLSYHQNISSFGTGVSLGWEKTDGFRENNDKDKKRIGAKVSCSPDEERAFDLSLDYSKEDRGRAGLPAYPSPRARAEAEVLSSIFSFKTDGLKSGTYFGLFEKKDTNPDKNLKTTLESRSLGENITSGFSLGKLGLITAGVDFEVAQVKGNKVESHQEEKCGAFASKDFELEAIPLNIGLGLRLNFYSEFSPEINPEIKSGVDFGNFNFQAAVSRTNNVPSFLQRYYETSTTKPNSALGMEKAMNYSVTLSHQSRKTLEESITLFLNEINDKITYVRQDDGTGSYENFGEVTRKGAEASVKWMPNGFLVIKPSYTYLIAKDELTGNWLSCSAKHRVKFDVQYKPIQQLNLTLNTKYVSKQFTRSDNKASVAGYIITDFRADYFLKKAKLFLKAANLFDKEYSYGDGYPAPPRTWLIGVNYEF